MPDFKRDIRKVCIGGYSAAEEALHLAERRWRVEHGLFCEGDKIAIALSVAVNKDFKSS